MLYLISGASRSGKSMLAKRLLRERGIAYLSSDWLMMGFNDGIPDYGIHHLLWPNDIAKRLWPFLKGMIEAIQLENVDYVIEGEAMLPEHLVTLLAKYPGRLRIAFLGFATVSLAEKVAQVKQHTGPDYDWLAAKGDDYISDHIGNMITYSRMIRDECEKHQLPFFDTSEDFTAGLEQAHQYLVGSAPVMSPRDS